MQETLEAPLGTSTASKRSITEPVWGEARREGLGILFCVQLARSALAGKRGVGGF
jgi:hypothetical protein